MGGGGGTQGKVPGQYMGWWGNIGSQPQKGITTYGLSPNRQRPFAGALNAAVFNTWRRSRGQVMYWVPPFVAAYFLMDWAEKRNHYLNSKHGRMHETEGGGAAETTGVLPGEATGGKEGEGTGMKG